MYKASAIYNFKVNATGERRPSMQTNRGKILVERLK